MIEYTLRKSVNFPREEVFFTLRDHQELLHYRLPNIRDAEIVKREEQGDSATYLVSRVKGKAFIPNMLRNALDPEKLQWYAHQMWDAENFTCRFSIESIYFKKHVMVDGRWNFHEKNGGTEIRIDNRLNIDARGIRGIPDPIAEPAGQMVERIIKELASLGLKRVCNKTEQLIHELREENGNSGRADEE